MNSSVPRRWFISSLLVSLAALLSGLFRKENVSRVAPEAPVKFYWVYEDSEAYCARDLAELNKVIDEQLGTDFIVHDSMVLSPWWARDPEESPRLTLENKGLHWDEISGNIEIYDEEERVLTRRQISLQQFAAENPHCVPGQLATAYN